LIVNIDDVSRILWQVNVKVNSLRGKIDALIRRDCILKRQSLLRTCNGTFQGGFETAVYPYAQIIRRAEGLAEQENPFKDNGVNRFERVGVPSIPLCGFLCEVGDQVHVAVTHERIY
jgi:hypothetical protein